MEARLRRAGSKANRVVMGLGGLQVVELVSRETTDGLWNDQL